MFSTGDYAGPPLRRIVTFIQNYQDLQLGTSCFPAFCYNWNLKFCGIFALAASYRSKEGVKG